METCSAVLTFESVDEILWCDHSNETFFNFEFWHSCRYIATLRCAKGLTVHAKIPSVIKGKIKYFQVSLFMFSLTIIFY